MTDKIDLNTYLQFPGVYLPSFRTALAIQDGVSKNLLISIWGGIGDQICAEPTLRYAVKNYKDCKISLVAGHPSLFNHLPVHALLDGKKTDYSKYLVFSTAFPQENIANEFYGQILTHCIDYASLCAFRMQLPISEREVILRPRLENVSSEIKQISETLLSNCVVVHPGRHWPSKTFPKDWWDKVIGQIKKRGAIPLIIGSRGTKTQGTVHIETEGCIDLRDVTTLEGSIYLLQKCKVLLTNDSAPLHMAATGNAWIGFIATVKHPDFITHFRKGQFGYRMKNFGKGGMWETYSTLPNVEKTIVIDQVDPSLLRKWLPDPIEYADWSIVKLNDEA